MAVENFEEKFAKIVSKTPSPLFQQIQWRFDNERWLKKSQAIAIQLGNMMESQNITKEQLTEKTNIPSAQLNNILKGKEYMTFKLIADLELALNQKIILIKDNLGIEPTSWLDDANKLIADFEPALAEKILLMNSGIEPTSWLDDAKYRAEDPWLRMAQAIAIQIGDCMDKLNMTEEDLSEKTNISLERIDDIMRGKEDMTIQTISKLEIALNTKFITMEYDFDEPETEELEDKKPIILDYPLDRLETEETKKIIDMYYSHFVSNDRKRIIRGYEQKQLYVSNLSDLQMIEHSATSLVLHLISKCIILNYVKIT